MDLLKFVSPPCRHLWLGSSAYGKSCPNGILVFDAPAFPNPSQPGSTMVQLQGFVSLRSIDIPAVTSSMEKSINALGINVGNKLATHQNHGKLLGAIGAPAEDLTLNIEGPSHCHRDQVFLALAYHCETFLLDNVVVAKVKTSFTGSQDIEATIFNLSDSGFSVISGKYVYSSSTYRRDNQSCSDIDDTVKVSNVLNKAALIKSTLIDDPHPVAEMPELYCLARSIQPQFIYVSGSPSIHCRAVSSAPRILL